MGEEKRTLPWKRLCLLDRLANDPLSPSAATPARVYIFELKVLTNIVKKRTFAFTGLGKSDEDQARTDDAENAFPDACRVDVGSGLMTFQSEHRNSADLERISS